MKKLSAFVLMLAVPAMAALPPGAVFTEGNATPDLGASVKSIRLDPNQIILPGIEARPCNANEMQQAWDMCQAVGTFVGGGRRLSSVSCSVRAGHIDRTCHFEAGIEPQPPTYWP